MIRVRISSRPRRSWRRLPVAALLLAVAAAAPMTPGAMPAGAYFTAQKTLPDNTLTTATLPRVTNLSVQDLGNGMTKISWDNSLRQAWAIGNGVSGVTYKVLGWGCKMMASFYFSGMADRMEISMRCPANSGFTVTYSYSNWTSPAASSNVITVGTHPTGIAISPDGKNVYVANNDSGSVSVIDAATHTVAATITMPSGMNPDQIAVSADGSKLYAVLPQYYGPWSGALLTIDSTSREVTNLLPIGTLYGITASQGGSLYASTSVDAHASTLSKYNPDGGLDLTEPVTVGGQPRGVAVSTDGARVYVANSADDTVSVVGSAWLNTLATVTVGSQPVSVATSSAFAYVTNSGDNTVSIIETSTETVTGTVMVGLNPQAIAVSAQGKSVYVANAGSNTVSVIDAARNTVVKTLPTGRTPSGIAISPDGGTIYVANKDDSTVSIIPTGRAETSTTG